MQNLVTTRLVNFNTGRSDPAERFVGIELDLEPHTLSQWSSGTNTDRRALLLNLRDAFATVRQQLVTGGYPTAEVSAALPVWFDSSSTISWLNTADRDQWFTDIGTSLDTISLMAYETSSISSILNSTSYEKNNFADETLLALRSKLGEEWTTYSNFTSAVASVEPQFGGGIDIESYYPLREIAPGPGAAGDFNNDGFVNAADYVVLRKGGTLFNDPIPGATAEDYAVWRSLYGASVGAASAAFNNIPEPAAWTLFAIAGCVAAPSRRLCS